MADSVQWLSQSHYSICSSILVESCTKYLLLTEFEDRTISYRQNFFLLDLWPKREAHCPKSKGEKRGSVTASMDQENEVSKIFIISLLHV